jgi:hypothetical protein
VSASGATVNVLSLGVLYHSTDGGSTWSEPLTIPNLNNEASLRQRGSVVVATENGSADGDYLCLWLSQDGGSTWTIIDTPLLAAAYGQQSVDIALYSGTPTIAFSARGNFGGSADLSGVVCLGTVGSGVAWNQIFSYSTANDADIGPVRITSTASPIVLVEDQDSSTPPALAMFQYAGGDYNGSTALFPGHSYG